MHLEFNIIYSIPQIDKGLNILYTLYHAVVAELVDAHDSKSCSFGSESSILSDGTNKGNNTTLNTAQ